MIRRRVQRDPLAGPARGGRPGCALRKSGSLPFRRQGTDTGRFAPRFDFAIEDPILMRTIMHEYGINSLLLAG
jgi:hypothetical protein